MEPRSYRAIDADAHIIEGEELFQRYLPASARARAPGLQPNAQGARRFFFDGVEHPPFPDEISIRKPMTAENRLKVLDKETTASMRSLPATMESHHSYAGGLLEHTVGVATLCRETAQLHPRLRADLLLAAALVHDVGRTVELGRGPVFRQTDEGRLLGHVHLGLRLIEAGAAMLGPGVRAELLHAVACHHDVRAARTAEAAVLYHANQLDAVAATRPVAE